MNIVIVILVILIIYLTIQRVKDKKKEDFEKREH